MSELFGQFTPCFICKHGPEERYCMSCFTNKKVIAMLTDPDYSGEIPGFKLCLDCTKKADEEELCFSCLANEEVIGVLKGKREVKFEPGIPFHVTMGKAPSCEHRWRYLRTIWSVEDNGERTIYRGIDTFFCERCLEVKEKVREEKVEGQYTTKPAWYGG